MNNKLKNNWGKNTFSNSYVLLGAPATAPNAYTPGRPKKQKTNFRFTLGTYLFQLFKFFNFDSEKLKTIRYFY